MGDILVKNNGVSGHVTIYYSGDAWNSPVIYEAPGTGMQIRRISRYLGSEYKPIRRDSMSSSGIILDNPTAKSTGGTDVGGNWTRSTGVAGYWGTDYQVHAATTGTRLGALDPAPAFHGQLRDLHALDRRHRPFLREHGDGQHPGRLVQALHQPEDQRVALGLARHVLVQVGLFDRVRQHHLVRDGGERLRRRRRGDVRPGVIAGT